MEMMSEDVNRLMATVSRAAGRELDPDVWEDRQIMNHGCQILNRMGHLPRSEYDKNVYGPFSFELNDLFKSAGKVNADLCDIPAEDIDALSALLSKGLDFLMAYNTLIAAFGYSPNKSHEDIKDWIVSNGCRNIDARADPSPSPSSTARCGSNLPGSCPDTSGDTPLPSPTG